MLEHHIYFVEFRSIKEKSAAQPIFFLWMQSEMSTAEKVL